MRRVLRFRSPIAASLSSLFLVLGASGCGGGASSPGGLTYATPAATYTKGVAIAANAPNAGAGPGVTFSVSPALPAGLSLDTATGAITGMPAAVTPTAVYTVTATGRASATLTITVNDVAPSNLAYAGSPAPYLKGTAIAAVAPTVGGGAVVTYSVSPPLPAGLTLDASSGVLSGTPTAVAAASSYTVTAANTGGSSQATFSITVNDLPPSNLAYSTNPAVYFQGDAIAPNAPSSSDGAVDSYSVSPPLPAGLSLDPVTGVISGTPTAVTATAAYLVTATNSGGSVQQNVNITVMESPPKDLAYLRNPAVYFRLDAIALNTPSSRGGTVTSYSVSPSLPDGLSLDPVSGVISGTPTRGQAATTYTVSATNSAGSASVRLSITVVNEC